MPVGWLFTTTNNGRGFNMMGEQGQEHSFRFEVDNIDDVIDENGDVEINIRHDDRFVEHVLKHMGVADFDEEVIRNFIVRAVYETYSEKS